MLRADRRGIWWRAGELVVGRALGKKKPRGLRVGGSIRGKLILVRLCLTGWGVSSTATTLRAEAASSRWAWAFGRSSPGPAFPGVPGQGPRHADRALPAAGAWPRGRGGAAGRWGRRSFSQSLSRGLWVRPAIAEAGRLPSRRSTRGHSARQGPVPNESGMTQGRRQRGPEGGLDRADAAERRRDAQRFRGCREGAARRDHARRQEAAAAAAVERVLARRDVPRGCRTEGGTARGTRTRRVWGVARRAPFPVRRPGATTAAVGAGPRCPARHRGEIAGAAEHRSTGGTGSSRARSAPGERAGPPASHGYGPRTGAQARLRRSGLPVAGADRSGGTGKR